MRRLLGHLLLVGLWALSLRQAPAAIAQGRAAIAVTTTAPGVAADGACSLVEALLNANADAPLHADCPAGAGADTIRLAPDALYTLVAPANPGDGGTGLPVISQRHHA